MSRFFSLTAALITCIASGGSGIAAPQYPPADAAPNTSADAASLARWQAALDQIALGHRTEARVLLEQARTRYGDAPEINLLLAWLAERGGHDAAPFLAPVSGKSRLAAAWATASPVPMAERSLPADTVPDASNSLQAGGTRPPVAPVAGTATVAPSPVVAQTDARLAGLEAYMVKRVNDERRALNLRPLVTDSVLADAARAHSTEMRDKRYFAHESPTAALAEPLDRYRAVFGQTPSLVAENIYRSWGSPRRLSEKEIDEAHTALMKSPGHHANIVTPEAARIGIGITVNATGDLWVTQMFARN